MKRVFTVDARTILRLGRDSIRDHTTALVELVKNSYDASASIVEVEINFQSTNPFIRITDNGEGMTEEQIDNNWLRIGFSHKARESYARDKRRKTGEKGIGRISADRLGARLRVLTKAKGSRAIGLEVDWSQFDVQGASLDSVEIAEVANPEIHLPRNADSGTELLITELRQPWNAAEMARLFDELSLLVSPFTNTSDFKIFLSSDVWAKGRVQVGSEFPKGAQLELHGHFEDGKFRYKIIQRTKSKTITKPNESIDWSHLVQEAGATNILKDASTKLGSVDISLLFFVQQPELITATGFSRADLKTFLRLNAGIKIYRDKIRVKPYGDPQDSQGDWLGLAERRSRNPAGVGRKSYRIAPNQLVGAVMLGRDSNPLLADSASREGLIKNSEFYSLRALLLGCISLLESARHLDYKQELEQSSPEKAADSVQSAAAQVKRLRALLVSLRKDIPPSAIRPLEITLDQADILTKAMATVKESVQELASQTSLYRGLATIGIASAVFGHETQATIDEFRASAQAAHAQLGMSPARVRPALDELRKAISYSERVAAWGSFALSRVQHEKRRKKEFDVKTLSLSLIKHLDPVFKAANIDLQHSLTASPVRAFEMDVEAVLLNLLTNAYHASQLNNSARQVKLTVSPKAWGERKGIAIAVEDTGPGVPDEFLQKIWEPLFSTRVDREGRQVGTGLGLTIVQSIIAEQSGKAEIKRSAEYGGAQFNIWLQDK